MSKKGCFDFNQLAIVAATEEIFGRDMQGLRNWLRCELSNYGIFNHWGPQDGAEKASNFNSAPRLQAFDRLISVNLKARIRVLNEHAVARPGECHNSLGPDLPWYEAP